MNKGRRTALAVGGLCLLFLAGYGMEAWLGTAPASDSKRAAAETPTATWLCPMHDHIRQDHAGNCPICGMDLVRDGGSSVAHHGGLEVSAAFQQRLGVRLATVEYRELRRRIRTWGIVALDETAHTEMNPKVDGWIRELGVSRVGQPVRAGQMLYEIYSPELVQRQREYIELLQRRDQLLQSMNQIAGQNAQLLASLARERMRSRRRFRQTDVDDVLIERIEKTRRELDVVPVYARSNGMVTSIAARRGGYVTPLASVMTLADLSRARVDITLYPDDLEWVAVDDPVIVRAQDGDERNYTGALLLSGAPVDPRAQIVRGYMKLRGTGRTWLPGVRVDVEIDAAPRRVLSVPRSAVIRTGDGARLMVAHGDGHFMPTRVRTGIEDSEHIAVLSGLREGDRVAVKGQFLLDAAASLQEARERMRRDDAS